MCPAPELRLTAGVPRPYRCPVELPTAAVACPHQAGSPRDHRVSCPPPTLAPHCGAAHDRPPVREPTSEQAHVPAQQPPPGEDPRLPPAHAHPGRPRDPRCPPPQGSLQALGLTARASGRGIGCVVRPTSPTPCEAPGRLGGTGLVVLHASPGDPETNAGVPARVGFVVPRAVGPAVIRNQVRRRLRHLVRDRLDRLPDGTRLVVRALRRGRGRHLRPARARAGPGAGPGGAVVSGVHRPAAGAPDPGLPAGDLPAARAALPVLPVLLGVRRRGAHDARSAARQLAGRPPAAPLPPVEPRRP